MNDGKEIVIIVVLFVKFYRKYKGNSMTINPRSLACLAQEALDIQDACNLSGLAHGFSRAMTDMCVHISNTDERNRHPICVLWLNKMANLSGADDFDLTGQAFIAVEILAQNK